MPRLHGAELAAPTPSGVPLAQESQLVPPAGSAKYGGTSDSTAPTTSKRISSSPIPAPVPVSIPVPSTSPSLDPVASAAVPALLAALGQREKDYWAVRRTFEAQQELWKEWWQAFSATKNTFSTAKTGTRDDDSESISSEGSFYGGHVDPPPFLDLPEVPMSHSSATHATTAAAATASAAAVIAAESRASAAEALLRAVREKAAAERDEIALLREAVAAETASAAAAAAASAEAVAAAEARAVEAVGRMRKAEAKVEELLRGRHAPRVSSISGGGQLRVEGSEGSVSGHAKVKRGSPTVALVHMDAGSTFARTPLPLPSHVPLHVFPPATAPAPDPAPVPAAAPAPAPVPAPVHQAPAPSSVPVAHVAAAAASAAFSGQQAQQGSSTAPHKQRETHAADGGGHELEEALKRHEILKHKEGLRRHEALRRIDALNGGTVGAVKPLPQPKQALVLQQYSHQKQQQQLQQQEEKGQESGGRDGHQQPSNPSLATLAQVQTQKAALSASGCSTAPEGPTESRSYSSKRRGSLPRPPLPLAPEFACEGGAISEAAIAIKGLIMSTAAGSHA